MSAGRLPQRRHCRIGGDEDHIRRDRDQFRGPDADAFGVFACEPVIKPNVTAIGPAKVLEALLEGREAGLHFRIIFAKGNQHADPPHPLGLLRPRRERPGRRRAAEKRDEFASLHVPRPGHVLN